MSTVIPALRRSPRVRRLARDHELRLRTVPGTGAGGRVTPEDVLRAAGEPRPAPGGAVLASPVGRRLLREAGVDPAEAARRAGGRPLTRVRAEGLLEERRRGESPPQRSDGGIGRRGRTDATAIALEVDVGELLGVMTAGRAGFVARHGFELGLEVPVGVALACVLATRPIAWGADRDNRRGVRVGFHTADADGVRTVPDAENLTVAGLARRLKAATPRPLGGPAEAAPTVTVTTDPAAPLEVLVDESEIGVLVLGEHELRRVEGTDNLGYEVVQTRPHVSVRLHHDDRLRADAADAVLTSLGETLTAWSLPVGA